MKIQTNYVKVLFIPKSESFFLISPNEYCTPCKTDLIPLTEKWGSNIYLDFNSNGKYNSGEFYAGSTN